MSIYDEIKGFDLLEDILEPMGFKQNLECRVLAQSVAQQKERAGIKKTSLKRSINDNKVPPNWTDLMMWAVLGGQLEMARLLYSANGAMAGVQMYARMLRIYREEGLRVCLRGGHKGALGTHGPMVLPDGPN